MSVSTSASDVAQRLGLKKYPRSWRGTCPACDYARVFSIKNGTHNQPVYFCANGCSQEQLAETLQRCFGEGWKPKPQADGAAENDATAQARKSQQAIATFNGSEALAAGDPAALYLERRGLSPFISSPALRYRGDCTHPEQGRYPALVAVVQDVNGASVAIHRTYLTRDGRKAAVEPTKASKGPVWGGAIRLHALATELVIGEGLETSASAGLLLGLPAWAAISAGNLARGLVLPREVQSLVIAADNDARGAKAAEDAAMRWRSEGRRVRIAWPDIPDHDFNDILLSRRELTHAA